MLAVSRKTVSGIFGPSRMLSTHKRKNNTLDDSESRSADVLRVRMGVHTHNILSTLDPERLKASDLVDISSCYRLFSGRVRYEPGQYFPPKTAGFFYFHRPQDAIPSSLAGVVRFRRVNGASADFASGTDLLLPNGLHWEYPLIGSLCQFSNWTQLLLEDGLITPTQLEQCKRMYNPREDGAYLHSFGQPFVTSFLERSQIFVVRGGGKHPVGFSGPFKDNRQTQQFGTPYNGKALVRFELSTLPEHTKKHKRLAVIRVLKFIEPPTLKDSKYDGYLLPPMEGQLMRKCIRNSVVRPSTTKLCHDYMQSLAQKRPSKRKFIPRQKVTPWTLNLDSGRGKLFGMLLDDERVPVEDRAVKAASAADGEEGETSDSEDSEDEGEHSDAPVD